jgi:hypothetical protein
MAITGYGEDALCYWALSCRLDEIVGTADATVLYRPSFGRRGSSPEKPSAQFGEFDAIIATQTVIHLIEAKWCFSSEIKGGKIDLRDEQSRRHAIFAEYLKAWQKRAQNESWEGFRERMGRRIAADGIDYPIPGEDARLAANLAAVLNRLGTKWEKIENVLLYLALRGETDLPTEAPKDFRLVKVVTDSCDGFVGLPCAG